MGGFSSGAGNATAQKPQFKGIAGMLGGLMGHGGGMGATTVPGQAAASGQPAQPNIYDQSAGAYNGALGAVNGAMAQNAMRGPGFASTATYSPITGQAALGQASTGQAQGYNAQMMGPSSMNAAQSNFTAQAQGYNPAMMQATTGKAQGYNPATGTATTYQAGNLGNAATYNAQQAG